VVLNGEGGDPCFGGPKNAPMLLAELLGDGAAAPDHLARARRYLRAHQKCYDDLPELLAPALRRELAGGALEELVAGWLDDPRRPSLLDRLLALNIAFKGAHHILPKVESLSWPAAVCPRSPLFDFGLVQHSFSIPARLKRSSAVEKYLLKESVRDLLPAAILERPKSGMLVPVEAWFKGPLIEFAREHLLDGLQRYGLFERRWVEALLEGRTPGLRPRRGVKIWLLLTLESWLRQKLGGGPA
jgi:asparagine synthase (glutamine-hydrolysing)